MIVFDGESGWRRNRGKKAGKYVSYRDGDGEEKGEGERREKGRGERERERERGEGERRGERERGEGGSRRTLRCSNMRRERGGGRGA